MYFIALMCLEEFQMQGGAKSLRGLNVDSAPLLLIMIYIYFFSPCDCFILDLKKEIIKDLVHAKLNKKVEINFLSIYWGSYFTSSFDLENQVNTVYVLTVRRCSYATESGLKRLDKRSLG